MATPLPTGGMTKMERSQIYNVYMRPWTLHMPWATLEVPHSTHLDRVPVEPDAMQVTRRKMARKRLNRTV